MQKTFQMYEVKFRMRYPYRDGYINKVTGLDYYCLTRTKTFYDYDKALSWAKKWCPFGCCITTFTCSETGQIEGFTKNFDSDTLLF